MNKSLQQHRKKIILSGGGTGGHIFPAIAIANALKNKLENPEILFIGAKGKMEMEKVPKAGYSIEGLWISGIHRKISTDNLVFPFKLIASLLKSNSIISRFKPDVVIGTGGYASGPTLRIASSKRIPCLIQEQNSFPGITNRLLAKKVNTICVAYENMNRYFPEEKLVFTGNPIRKDITELKGKKDKGLQAFKLDKSKKTLLIVGGSQGSRAINIQISEMLEELIKNDIQLLWQTGKHYEEKALQHLEELKNKYKTAEKLIKITPFIYSMDLAFAIADVCISRAGAIAISEFAAAGLPSILIPLPSAAEDHQKRNAQALVDKNSAIMIEQSKMKDILQHTAIDLLKNEGRQKELKMNILQFAVPDAADQIADEVIKIMK